MPNDVLWLADVPEKSRSLVGGKASELATLIRLGLPVPPGFVLTPQVHETVELASGVPESIKQQLAIALDILRTHIDSSGRVIVRSSAPFEDSAHFSAAGQLQSIPSAPQLDDVLAALQTCYAAARGPELLDYYRFAGGAGQPYLAVIIQELVETDAAGVLFSSGLGSSGAIVVEANSGESSRVTSGTASPDRYVVERHTHAVLSASGDTLHNDQIKTLAAIAERLEAHYGAPQDIEWGFRDGELFIFQTRPITATAQDDWFASLEVDPRLIWVSGFFEERFPGAVSLLTWSYLFPAIEQTALREPLHYIGVRDAGQVPILRLFNGHVYTNMAVFQMIYKFFPSFLLPGDARRFFPGGNTDLRRQVKEPRFLNLAIHITRTIFTEGNWHPFNYRVWHCFAARHEMEMRHIRGLLDGDPDVPELLDLLNHLRGLTVRLLRIHRWSLNYAEVFSSLLRRMMQRWTRLDPERIESLLVSAENSPTLRSNRQLRVMADLSPVARSKVMERFLLEFGHRSFCLDLICPRWADDPEAVWAMIEDMGQSPSVPGDSRASERQQIAQELRRQLRACWISRLIPVRSWLVNAVLFFARRYATLREEQRFEWQKGLYQMRRAFLGIERDFIARGVLHQSGDIFFLTWDEIQAIAAGETLEQPEVANRRRHFRQVQYAPYPRFIRGDQPYGEDSHLNENMLQGVGASAGQAVGRARVIMKPDSLSDLLNNLKEGDVLVTAAADPGWTPAFGRVRALVMSLGGQLSHGAIVAREYGLPAVVGLGSQVDQIHDGDQLLVDGSTGEIFILSPEEQLLP